MNKKKMIIGIGIFAVAAVAALFFFSSDTVRETPSDRNSTPNRDQTIVQVSRPDVASAEVTPAGPDSPVLPKAKPAAAKDSEEKTTALPREPVTATAEEILDEEVLYQKAMVFRDEALGTFPVYTVQVFQPDSIEEDLQTGRIGGKTFGPKPNEVWLRIKPDNAKEVREIMAQTADLYREYVNESKENIVVVNWVGGQAWARMEFGPDGGLITH